MIAIKLWLLGLLWGAAATAHAQANPAEEYKKAIEGAVYEFDAGNWPEARVLFEQAHALRPSARTLRGMGKVSFELKEYVRAQKELNMSLVELRSPLSEAQRHEVLGLLLRVEKFIGKLSIRVKSVDAPVSITLDGSTVEGELKLDLGQHELSVQAPGYRTLIRAVSIEGGKTQRLELTLTPIDLAHVSQPVAAEQDAALFGSNAPASPQPNDRDGVLQQWWFWTIVGVVVVGGAATAIALTQSHPEPAVAGNTGLHVEVLTLAR